MALRLRALALLAAGALGAAPFACAGQPSVVPRAGDAAVTDVQAPDATLPVTVVDAASDASREDEEAARIERVRWSGIDEAVATALTEGKMPGCVVVVGRRDAVLFQKAYGSKAILPERRPMTVDTVFDLASLTKPIATATSIHLLAERGLVDLDARASKYVPELAKLPPFTVRQLLVHTSGLPAATSTTDFSTDRADVVRRIAALTLKAQPGERFNYSDIGFIVLEEIVRRASNQELSTFAQHAIFTPLGMSETGFLPPPGLRARAAPTEMRDGGYASGDVHDPRAFAMGGVAGHAGLFSTAQDLSRFARMLLAHGKLDGSPFLDGKTFDRMVARHETSKGGRALGWDIDSTFASHRSPLLSKGAFGHGGYTGTALWIDPEKDLFVLFLSNRVHPDGKGAVNPLVAEIATRAVTAAQVKPGIDVLRDEAFASLRGASIGLVTNASARNVSGVTTADALRQAEGVTLKTIFTPEHGFGADREGTIKDATYEGIPVVSLYVMGAGERLAPDATSLDGIDTLVVDLQDVGVRFYTYASTMKRAMHVAAAKKLRFVVLDRPNPLGGVAVEGPVLTIDPAQKASFVQHHALPIRHGMTMGELARLFAADDHLDLRLDVVKARGWRRAEWFDSTGLVWTPPSPNLKSVKAVVLYPAIGLLEGTQVSVGRGTDMPFEIVAAPWMDAEAVAKKLGAMKLDGVTFETLEVTPKSSVHANKRCKGIRVRVSDRVTFDPIRTGLAIASVLRELHGSEWDFDNVDRLLKSKPALDAIRRLGTGGSWSEIEASYRDDLVAFRARRDAFLLYR